MIEPRQVAIDIDAPMPELGALLVLARAALTGRGAEAACAVDCLRGRVG